MDFWKQIYVVKEVFVYMYFAGFYLPLNPSATIVYARSAFYPSLRFNLFSIGSLHFTLSLHFTPGPQSTVRSPQSASYTDLLHGNGSPYG